VIVKKAKKPKGWPVPGTGWNPGYPEKPATESESTVPVLKPPESPPTVYTAADLKTMRTWRGVSPPEVEWSIGPTIESMQAVIGAQWPWYPTKEPWFPVIREDTPEWKYRKPRVSQSEGSPSHAAPRKCYAMPYKYADCGALLIPVMGRQIGGYFKVRLLHPPLFKKGYLEGLWYFDETAKWKDKLFQHVARCDTMEGFSGGWGRFPKWRLPKTLPDPNGIFAGKGWEEPWTEETPLNGKLVAESKLPIGPCTSRLRPGSYTPDDIAAHFNRWGRMFPESARYFGLNKRRRDGEYGPARYKFGLVPHCTQCEPLLKPDYLPQQESHWHGTYLMETFQKDVLRWSWEYIRHWWPKVYGLLVPENVILKKDPEALPKTLRVGTIANAEERLQAYQFQFLGIQFPSKIFECATRFTDLQAERENESRLSQDDLPANLGRELSNPDVEHSDEDAAAEDSERIERDTEDSSDYLGFDTEGIDAPDVTAEAEEPSQPLRRKRVFPSDDHVLVFNRLKAGDKPADIARDLGVDQRTVYRMKAQNNWSLVHEIQRRWLQKRRKQISEAAAMKAMMVPQRIPESATYPNNRMGEDSGWGAACEHRSASR
jgi:hypothetical protein